MRIVTRADFDGIVCATLLFEAEAINDPVMWVTPNDMQKGLVDIQPDDIIANLPYDRRCRLWFDHHFSNRIRHSFEGLFSLAPSAAGLVYQYYRGRFKRDYTELVSETDKIDSASLSLDEILYPERFPYVLLSMTIQSQLESEEHYWNHLIDLLRKHRIEGVMIDPLVRKRCEAKVEENKLYKTLLEKHTTMKEHVAITDFRQFDRLPQGNRFLVYSMFPEAMVSVKIGYRDETKEMMVVKVGHSILNKNCNVNVGQMLSYFEGGGHPGAGSCRFHVSKKDEYLNKIIDILIKNEAEGSIVEKKERSKYDRRVNPDRRHTDSEAYFESGGVERRWLKEQRVLPEPRKNWVGKPRVSSN
jgi:oligoribonuclease NrnB/cAMP/cGMP phosphodiesterase (DHH superfamily)